MTKVEAIKAVMEREGRPLTLTEIYKGVCEVRPESKRDGMDWQAGIRGVLYRDVGKTFEKFGEATYKLIEPDTLCVQLGEDACPRMVSFFAFGRRVGSVSLERLTDAGDELSQYLIVFFDDEIIEEDDGGEILKEGHRDGSIIQSIALA